MARPIKYAGIFLTVLAGLSVLAVVVINLIPGETYKTLISSGVNSATARELVIEGELDIKLTTTLAFNASGVKFTNAEWGSRPQMMSVDSIRGEVALLPLLKGILDASLVVDSPDLLLETDISGRGNWQFEESKEGLVEGPKVDEEVEKEAIKSEKKGGLRLVPLIRKLHFNQARIAYFDRKSGDRIDFHSDKLHVKSTEEELTVDLQGKLNGTPLSLFGGFDSADIFIDNQPVNAEFDGHLGDAKLVVKGTAGPLMPKLDLDVTLFMDTDSVTAFSPIAGRKLPDIGPLSVSAKLTGKEGKYALSDMLAILDDKILTAEAKGSITDLIGLDGLKLEAEIDTGHLTEVLKGFGFHSEYPLPEKVNVAVVAEGNLKELPIKQFQTNIEGQGLIVSGTAEVKNIVRMEGVSADFSLEMDSLDLFEEITKTELPPFGPLKARANIVSKGEKLTLMEIKADLNGEIIRADMAGSIGDPLNLKDVNADVNLEVDSLAWLAEYIKTKLPPMGALKASANIVSKGETFEIKDINANLDGKNITAKMTGVVGDLLKVQGISATVNLGVQSLAFLSDYVKMKLPPLGPLKASASIFSKGDTLSAKNIKADLTGDKIAAKAAGAVGDLLKLEAIKADVALSIESLAFLSDIVKTKLPPLGPLNASANITSVGETFEVKNIKAGLSDEKIQAKVEGSVKDALKLTGIIADINFTVDSLASLNTLVKQELPASDPVTLEGKFSSEGGLKAPNSIVAVVKSDGVTASLTGSIAEPLEVKGIDLALVVEAESMQKLGKLAGKEFQGQKPVKIEGKFTADEKTYELAGLHLKIGELDVKGKAAFTQPSDSGGRPRLSGELHVGDLDISKRQAAKRNEVGAEIMDEPDTEEEVEAEKKDKVFSSEPLPFGPLRSVDADIAVTVKNLITQQIQLGDLVASLTLENGLLNLNPMRATVGNGTFGGTLMLDASNTPVVLAADIEMADGTFRNFGGKINFLANVNGSGDSIAAIMAGLDGQFVLHVREAALKSSLMTGFGSGLLSSLNPFSKDQETTELNCAILRFDIKDGIANAKRKIVAQMTDVTWFGSGKINLKTEEIAFRVHPKARKFLSVGVGNLAKLVHIGGTLAVPKIALDPKDLVVKYGKYTAAVVTGGLTLALDHLWTKIRANTDVCTRILEDLERNK